MSLPLRRAKEQIAFLQASLLRMLAAQETLTNVLKLEQGLRLRAEAKLARRARMSAVPDPYTPATDFSDYASSNPDYALPGTQMDVEFNELKSALDARDARMAEIQRDDGAIRNGIVTLDSLSAEAKRNMATPTIWATATAYLIGNQVIKDGSLYLCIVDHTSGTFSTDLAALKWTLLGPIAALVAGQVLKSSLYGIDVGTVTGTIPRDSSAPQSNEGTQILSVSFTPLYDSSLIRVTLAAEVKYASVGTKTFRHLCAGVFVGSETDAFMAGYVSGFNGADDSQAMYLNLQCRALYILAHTGAMTIKVRCGDSAGNSVAVGPQATMGFPGEPTALKGNANSWLLVEEIKG